MSEHSLASVRTRWIDLPTRGGRIATYEVGPADRPVELVFSHANGFNARTYLSILAPLERQLRVLLIDMRGHGRTELPVSTADRSSWNDLRDDLLAVLAAENLRDVRLAGHSMGATVSLLAAAQAPEAVRDLVLFEPVIMAPGAGGEPGDSAIVQGALKRRADFPSREAALQSYAGRGPFKGWSPAMLADYVQDGFRDITTGGVTLSARPEWEFDNYVHQAHDALGALAASRCPIQIYKADAGSTCRLDATDLGRLAPGRGAMETVPDVSHFLPMERPDLVAAVLSRRLG